jgi:hypothetical protein
LAGSALEIFSALFLLAAIFPTVYQIYELLIDRRVFVYHPHRCSLLRFVSFEMDYLTIELSCLEFSGVALEISQHLFYQRYRGEH